MCLFYICIYFPTRLKKNICSSTSLVNSVHIVVFSLKHRAENLGLEMLSKYNQLRNDQLSYSIKGIASIVQDF